MTVMPPAAELPVVVLRNDDDEIVALLRELQTMVIKHPEASRAAVAALAEEGRRFAQTAQGGPLKERLARSALLGRATLVWQTVTLNLLEPDLLEPGEGALPSRLVDAITMAASAEQRDAMLERLFRAPASAPPDQARKQDR
jgi:hypothetical protein